MKESATAKSILRSQAKELRRDRNTDHAGLCSGLRTFLRDRNQPERWMLTFMAIPGEPDLAGLVPHPDSDPRIRSDRFAITRTPARSPARSAEASVRATDLSIHPLDSELERHFYGFKQPVEGSEVVDDGSIGVVLVPGLAFDPEGGRLGFGAGYYDRLLSRLIAASGVDQLAIIGISDGFIVDHVPMQDHDVPMTHLATADGVVAIAQS